MSINLSKRKIRENLFSKTGYELLSTNGWIQPVLRSMQFEEGNQPDISTSRIPSDFIVLDVRLVLAQRVTVPFGDYGGEKFEHIKEYIAAAIFNELYGDVLTRLYQLNQLMFVGTQEECVVKLTQIINHIEDPEYGR
jgi:hypothetical protein